MDPTNKKHTFSSILAFFNYNVFILHSFLSLFASTYETMISPLTLYETLLQIDNLKSVNSY